MSPELTLAAVNCIILLVLLLQMMKLRRLAQELKRQKQTLVEVKGEIDALLLCERGMGERIKQQQYQVRDVIERQDKLEISDRPGTSYKQAMVLLQKGASTDELIEACDLSRGELELLARLKVASKSISRSRAA